MELGDLGAYWASVCSGSTLRCCCATCGTVIAYGAMECAVLTWHVVLQDVRTCALNALSCSTTCHVPQYRFSASVPISVRSTDFSTDFSALSRALKSVLKSVLR
eukprot:240416-Rhodomonas_salina.1